MEKYKNKYRIPSARLQNWDYGWNASYFITICTHNRECYFGEIVDTVETQCIASLRPPIAMQLSEIGKIVESEWIKTPEIRPDMNLKLGAFVVMPNHFHAIIMIGENQYNRERGVVGRGGGNDAMDRCRGNDAMHHCTGRDAMHCVSTTTTTTTGDTPSPQNRFGPQSKNLASILRGFKSSVTKQARPINPDFAWQPLFHDHVIRDAQSYQRIEQYTVNNPRNWEQDKFYK
jgi:putative transposase